MSPSLNSRTPMLPIALSMAIGSVGLVAAANGNTGGRGTDGAVDFHRDIRPILSRNCFRCHGPDEAAREAGLRLDTREGAFGTLRRGGPAIVPGDVEASGLIARITSPHDHQRMPPPESGIELTREEIELLKSWITAGAEWKAHWAFIPPARPTPAEQGLDGRMVDPIDRYLLDALREAGLSPGPAAGPATLLRRLSFDLNGLPPTVEEVQAFVEAGDDEAYDQAVDRLLASPRYGEHRAADWLDLARYSDTYGYQSDVDRVVWPYRDWVISAFNANLPHDRFLTWQLAGDLLPEATREQKLATTFNRLHRQTNEGGSVEEEYRVEYVADRVHTFGTSMLGMTFECARCHDHKYDPISQREYYQLHAFFDNIDESGLYSHFTQAVPTPALALPTVEQETRLAELTEQVMSLEAGLEALAADRRGVFDTWRSALGEAGPDIPGLVGHYPLDGIQDGALVNVVDPKQPGEAVDEPVPVNGAIGGGLALNGENALRFPGVAEFTRSDPFTLAFWLRMTEARERAVVIHRSRAWTDAGSQGYELLLLDGVPSWSLIHFWPGDAISVQAEESIVTGEWTHIAVSSDGSSRASGLAMHINGRPVPVRVVRDHLTLPITGGGPGPLAVGARFRDRGFAGGEVDDLRVFDRSLSSVEISRLHAGGSAIDPREMDGDELFNWYVSAHDPDMRQAREQLRDARRALADARSRIPRIMTMREMDRPRQTWTLGRGRYDNRMEPVGPATPVAIMPFDEGLPGNRLGLARWLTDAGNPLAARVAVNRLWMQLFGQGLVATPEDFGNQGAIPSHPELLDALALDYIASGWDTKAMLRRLVRTDAYRRSSRATALQVELDPENRLLARGPSRRLSAEMLRDHVLSASGLLVERLGGPSVHPYQPAGLWQEKSGRVYPQGTGESLYRRSLYTFWKLTSPPPSMLILDASSREVCVARRQSTTTPMQALLILNDPQFVEASRALAQRAMLEIDGGHEERIGFMFTALTSRAPRPAEVSILVETHRRQRALFQADPAAAATLVAIGDSRPAQEIDPVELAAYAMVGSAIMNTDAAVMRR